MYCVRAPNDRSQPTIRAQRLHNILTHYYLTIMLGINNTLIEIDNLGPSNKLIYTSIA